MFSKLSNIIRMKITILFLVCFLATFLSQLSLSHSQKQKCHPQDREILLKIKAAFGNPYHLASWIPGTDCCNWYVVECDPTNHRINEIHLFQANISGTIPEAIAELPYLERLTLRKLTNLTGTIPYFLSKIPRLTWLRISWTNISGPIPSFLGEMKNLTYLELSFNNLTGPIPESLGQLTKLFALRLDRNRLTGSIPDWFGRFPFMYLSHNQFTGSIPKEWNNYNFSIVELGRNRLEGDISALFGKNKSVEHVDVSRNMLQFDMSNIEFPESLSSLDLNHNMITGSLPESLNQIGSLNVSYNRMCGQIPAGGTLSTLDYTSFFHNRCLCGAPLPNSCK